MAGLSLKGNATASAATMTPSSAGVSSSAFNPGLSGVSTASSGGGLSAMSGGFGAGFGVSVLSLALLVFIRHSLPR